MKNKQRPHILVEGEENQEDMPELSTLLWTSPTSRRR
jgi:hypothetical protein